MKGEKAKFEEAGVKKGENGVVTQDIAIFLNGSLGTGVQGSTFFLSQ